MSRLVRYSLVALILGSILPAVTWAQQIKPGANIEDLIPVKKGDVLSITPGNAAARKHTLVSTALKAVGVAVANYKPMTESGGPKAAGKETSVTYAPIGAGIILGSDKIARISSHNYQTLRYTLYNKSGDVVETHVVAITNKELKARSGIVTLGTASEDGYLKLERLNPAGEFTTDYSLNLNLEQTPAEISSTEESPEPSRALNLPERAAIVSSHPSGLIAPPSFPVMRLTTTTAPKTAPRAALAIRTNPALRTAAVIPHTATPSKGALVQKLKTPALPAGKSLPVRSPFIFALAKNPESAKDDNTSDHEGDEEEDLVIKTKPDLLPPPDDDDDDDDGDDDDDDDGGGGGDGGGGDDADDGDVDDDDGADDGDDDDDDNDPNDYEDSDCTNDSINAGYGGSDGQSYLDCVCSEAEEDGDDLTACQQTNTSPPAPSMCTACWTTFGVATASALATYFTVAIPNCNADPAASQAHCRTTAATTLEIALGTASANLGICLKHNNCTI